MDLSHISLLRDSYMIESKRPDGRKSTVGEYMRFITDNNLEFITSKDFVFIDDGNTMVHSISINEDMVSQADFPVKIISAAFEDIHAIEAIMSRENFKKFLNDGFLKNIMSSARKDFLLKWIDNVNIQAQQPMDATPYYKQTPYINSKHSTTIARDDGVLTPSSPATLASMSIVATSDAKSLKAAIAEGKSVMLSNDMTLDESLVIESDIDIDLCGHTITGAEKSRVIVVKSGNVSINNGTVIANGNDAFYLNGIVKDGGDAPTLTLGDGLNVIADDCCVLLKGPNATLNTYASMESIGGAYAAIQGNGSHGGITVNVYGGSVDSKDAAIYFPCKADLNIYGGIITGKTAVYHKSGNLNICGGELFANGNKIDYKHNSNGCDVTGDTVVIEACDYPDGVPVVSISGGKFTSLNANSIGYYQQSEEYSLANTKFISNGVFSNDVSEYVESGKYASKVEENVYEIMTIDPSNVSSGNELKAAISAYSNIAIGNDITINSSMIIDKDVSIDLNGKKLTVNVESNTENAIGIGAKNNARVVITGNGIIDAGSGNAANIAVYASGATIDIMNGTFINGLDNDGNYSDLIYAGKGGIVNIYDGVFEASGTDKYWTLNLKDNTGSAINVMGGKFKNFDPAEAYTEPEQPYSFLAPGYYSIKDEEYYIVKKADNTESISVAAGEHKVIDTTVSIGETNGVNTHALYADGEGSVLDITGGHYDSGMGASNAAVLAKNGATVNISNGTFVSRYDQDGQGNSCVEANGATINISGGYFECTTPYADKYWVLNKKDNTGAVINVTGGTFVNFDPSNGNTENPNESFVAEGYHVVNEGNKYTVVPN